MMRRNQLVDPGIQTYTYSMYGCVCVSTTIDYSRTIYKRISYTYIIVTYVVHTMYILPPSYLIRIFTLNIYLYAYCIIDVYVSLSVRLSDCLVTESPKMNR